MVAQDALDVLTDEIIEFVAEVAAQQSEEDIQKNTQIPVIRKKSLKLKIKSTT